jgi:hypothetical protein
LPKAETWLCPRLPCSSKDSSQRHSAMSEAHALSRAGASPQGHAGLCGPRGSGAAGREPMGKGRLRGRGMWPAVEIVPAAGL